MSIAEEAKELARVAADQAPGEVITFSLRPDLHGQGAKVIQGAENILKEDGETGIKFTVESEDIIRVEA